MWTKPSVDYYGDIHDVADALMLSTRQVERLLAQHVIEKEEDGSFHMSSTIEAYYEHHFLGESIWEKVHKRKLEREREARARAEGTG